MGDWFSGGYEDAAQIQAKAAKKAAGQREALTREGLGEYRDIIQPYLSAGEPGINYLANVYGSPEQQQAALAQYQSSPSANLLQAAIEDAVRRSQGSAAAGGMLRSGAQVESLGRRLSDMNLNDYYKYQQGAQNLGQLGQGAALQGGGNILQTFSNIGDIQGTGTIGRGNALAQGEIAGQNAFNSLINTGLSALGTVAGGALGGPIGASLGGSIGGSSAPQYNSQGYEMAPWGVLKPY